MRIAESSHDRRHDKLLHESRCSRTFSFSFSFYPSSRSRSIARNNTFPTHFGRNETIRSEGSIMHMRERNHFCHRSNHSIALSSLPPFARSDRSNTSWRLSVFYYRRFSQFDSCFSSASLFVYHRGTCVCVCVHRKRLLRLGA